ncbi:uncharacterized protein C5orf34 homolog [Saccoglossus kowalevskii]|uniref:Uncharacterized protein C5orf34-like n=1 Tax=Saccoglossus kowalevskii TaxID=10224 RepID=A0ABM0GUP2_SACKO|nr:PREDICTED: uncharacterized protein C5orf34-like [Saccoglossus kowalevskii]
MAYSPLPSVNQMMIFCNDAVEVTYSDGSQLQLSPCGTVFIHEKKPTSHPLQQLHRVQQRTQFVTSEFKGKIQEALEFRNHFAEKPFICPALINTQDIVTMPTNIKQVRWVKQPNQEYVKLHKDGSVSVTSLDKYASLILAPHKQEFSVKYIAEVSQHLDRKLEPRKNATSPLDNLDHGGSFTVLLNQQHPTTPCDDEMNAAIEGKHGTSCTFIVSRHSLVDYPDCWEHPLNLAISVSGGQGNIDKVHSDNTKKNKDSVIREKTGDVIKCLLPNSLPIRCPASHLHNWNKTSNGVDTAEPYNVRQEKLKVIWTENVVYRLCWGSKPCVELLPGDASIIKSKGPTGCFFTHCWYNNDKIEERVYSVDNPPPDMTTQIYSVRRLITKAARIFQQMVQHDSYLLDSEINCCWKVKPTSMQPSMPTTSAILEQCCVDNLGKFTAHTNGRVHIVFKDRTMLDMRWDFSSRLKKMYLDKDDQEDNSENRPPYIDNDQTIPAGACRLLLSNGQYQIVNLHQSQGFTKYVSLAMEWVTWVNSSPNERMNFYEGRDKDFTSSRSVAAELQKIKCFNYLLENCSANTNTCQQSVMSNHSGPGMVQDVLKRTSQTINDINALLDKS